MYLHVKLLTIDELFLKLFYHRHTKNICRIFNYNEHNKLPNIGYNILL